MNKSKTNFIIDAIMFLIMMSLVGTGFVRKYILLSGSASRAVYGRKVDMLMLGLTRDDWSTVHLYVGYFLMFLLLLHIILHWKQITVMFKQLIKDNVLRIALLVVFVIVSVFMVVFPFILQPTMLS